MRMGITVLTHEHSKDATVLLYWSYPGDESDNVVNLS